MTHYSYLREPMLERSGYTLGYETGSLSYLENGIINFSDRIVYYDGQYDEEHDEIDDDRNTTVEHHQHVYFDGKKGISEFYAKGFYPNNRALSAWKKIRYDDISYNFTRRSTEEREHIAYLGSQSRFHKVEASNSSYTVTGSYDLYEDGNSYLSNKIDVTANATMGPVYDYQYNFSYSATVTNGVIETRDATGWTNETRAKMTDWERDALMRGNVSVTNTLSSGDLFYPGGGDDEYLSCCLPSGTSPPIEVPEDSDWPNQGTYGVLSPDKLLPDNTICCPECTPEKLADCYEKCNKYNGTVNKEHCLDDCNETCTNFTCTKANCPGFECINTYALGEGTPSVDKPLVQQYDIAITNTIASINDIDEEEDEYTDKMIEANSSLSNKDIVTYKIGVNYGDFKNSLETVTIKDALPDGLIYEPHTMSFWFEYGDGLSTDKTSENDQFDWNTNSNVLTWNIPEINQGWLLVIQFGTKVINVNASNCLIFENKVDVEAFVETDTEMIERTAKSEGATIVGDYSIVCGT